MTSPRHFSTSPSSEVASGHEGLLWHFFCWKESHGSVKCALH